MAELQKIVARHGSIMRVVPQETDIGIDAFIELVHGENATADLLAVQIKGGDSFVHDEREFWVYTDERHIAYWNNLLMPVLLVCHSPAKGITCWTSIHDEIERARYHARPLKKIVVPLSRTLTVESLTSIGCTLALRYRHQFSILKYIDQAFSVTASERLEAIEIISAHPSALYSPTAALVARRLLSDDDDEVVRKATWFLGYCAGRGRWSWNPTNPDERFVSAMAARVCEDMPPELFRRMFEAQLTV